MYVDAIFGAWTRYPRHPDDAGQARSGRRYVTPDPAQ